MNVHVHVHYSSLKSIALPSVFLLSSETRLSNRLTWESEGHVSSLFDLISIPNLDCYIISESVKSSKYVHIPRPRAVVTSTESSLLCVPILLVHCVYSLASM